MRTLFLSLFFASFLVLSGCGVLSLDDEGEGLAELISENRELWQETNLENYNYTYNLGIGEQQLEDIQVFVRGGVVDSAAVDGVGVEDISARSDSQLFVTVDDLFVRVRDAFERDTDGVFTAAFNDLYGFPTRYRALASESTPGEQLSVQNFDDLQEQ